MSELYSGRLAVEMFGLKLNSPVMTASGTCGFGLELMDFVQLDKLGALVVKGTSLEPWLGNEGLRIAETPAGMLNSIGLENPGVDDFLKKKLPILKKFSVPIVVNIVGRTLEEYVKVAEKLDVEGITALELNISCPNVKAGGIAFGTCPENAAEVVSMVKKAANKPVITKLSPNVTDITEIAKAVEAAGTDAISLINTLLGMKIDLKSKKPALGNVFGGLSGPAIRPVAVRMVYQVTKAVKVPVIGMGGIITAEDALEFILAGAHAIAIGTGTFIDPRTVHQVTEGILTWLDREGFDNIGQIRGLAHK